VLRLPATKAAVEIERTFFQSIKQAKRGEQIDYIRRAIPQGVFYGPEPRGQSGVLIPRPETEAAGWISRAELEF